MVLLKGWHLRSHAFLGWSRPVDAVSRHFRSHGRSSVPSPRCSTVENSAGAETTSMETAPMTQELFCFDTSVQTIPHPDKVEFGGEDAYFLLEPFGFGVADGVGGWREGGVNPADYSRQIMQVTSEKLQLGVDLTTALDVAHMKTRMPGSCTACLVRLDGVTGKLSALNLGDSGYVVIRDDAIVRRSTAQQHYFDCPKQLAAYPEFCRATDTVQDAEMQSVQLQEGDLIVMGTDGLWDNVYDSDMLNFASNKYGPRKTVEELSEGLARLAQRNSLDEEFKSPYAVAALEEGYTVPWTDKIRKARVRNWRLEFGSLTGGKLDDITVIVAKVTKGTFPTPESASSD